METGAHSRSDVAVGACASYSVEAQIERSAHCRSDIDSGALVSYCPAAHTRTWLHVRSAVADGATDVYWPVGHVVLCVLHVRLLVAVGLAVSYSPDVQCMTAPHTAPLSCAE